MLMLDYQRKARLPHRLGIAVLIVAVMGLVALVADYYDLVAAMDESGRAARMLERSASARGGAAGRHHDKAAGTQAQEIALANRVLRELSIPWDTLFKAVEDAGSKDVTLLGLEPDPEKRVVKIVGEARNFAAVLGYLRQLQLQPVLRDVHLQHHQVEQQDPEKPVRFTMMGGWEARP